MTTESQTTAAADIRAIIPTLADMSIPQLVETWNLFAPGAKKVNRFATKKKGYQRTLKLLTKLSDELDPEPEVEPEVEPTVEPEVEPTVEPAPEPEVEPGKSKSRATGQRKAWTDPRTREARSRRWACKVEGHGVTQSFKSVPKAFTALGLSFRRVQYVRKHMVVNGTMAYAGYVFTRVAAEECDVD